MKQIAANTSTAAVERLQAGQLASASARPAALPEQALFQPELRRSLQMHGKLAVVVALIGLAITGFYFSRLWPVYQAKSLLYVQPAPTSLMNQNNANRWPVDGATYETFLQQKIGDVTRPDVMAAAVHKMEPGLFQGPGESDQAAAERLSHMVQVERSGSYQISISVRSAKPETAAAITNAVTNAYLESATHDAKSGDVQRMAILKEEHDRVQAELNADRAEQTTLSRQLGMAAPAPNAPDLYDQQIANTRTELIRVRTEHDEAAARLASMSSTTGSSTSALDAQADEVAATDPGLGSMKTALNQRKATLVSQMSGLTPNHPLYKQDQAELDKINAELESASHKLHAQAADHIQQKLRSDLERTAAVEDKLNGQLRSAVGAAAGASIKIQRANDINADITRLQNRFAAVDEQLHNLILDSGAPGAITLIDPAVAPLHAIRTGVFRNTLVLGFASIFLGILLAVVVHKMDPRIYIASDVEQVLGFAPMAELPHFAQISEPVEAEQLIRLAGDIEHVALQDDIQTVALTSAAEGSGVGSLAARLRPLLAPAASLAAGTPTAGVNLVEAGPLLVSAGAEFQVRRADWTIAVIESGVTTRAELRSLASTLKRLDAPAVGFILHQVSLDKADPAFRRSIREAERHVEHNGVSSPLRILEQRLQQASVAAPPQPQEQLAAPVAAGQPVQPQFNQSPQPVPAQQPAQAPAAQPAAPAAEPWWLAQMAPAPQPVPAPRYTQPASSQPQEDRPAAPAPVYPVANSFAASPEPSAPVPSRLNGLRGSAFQLGLMHLNRGAEPRPEAAAAPPYAPAQPQAAPQAYPFYAQPAPAPAAPVEPAVQINRPVAAAAPFAATQGSAMPPAAAPAAPPTEVAFTPSAREVLAEPEFLPPPREFIPMQEGEDSEDGSARRDRRETVDELGILPSWRGQYRKRS